MLLNCLEPWIKNRSEEVLRKYNEQQEEAYMQFLVNLARIREKINDRETKILLLELEEIYNAQQETLVTEVYRTAFAESFQLARSIYK